MALYKCTKCKQLKEESEFRPMSGKMKNERNRPVRYHCKSCDSGYIISDKNKELASERAKRERINHPRKIWAKTSFYTHRKRGFDIIFTWKDLEKLANQTDICPICGCKLDWSVNTKDGKAQNNSPSLDRFNNENVLSKDNIWIICHYCNKAKGDKTLIHFLDYCKLINKRRESILVSASDLTLMAR